MELWSTLNRSFSGGLSPLQIVPSRVETPTQDFRVDPIVLRLPSIKCIPVDPQPPANLFGVASLAHSNGSENLSSVNLLFPGFFPFSTSTRAFRRFNWTTFGGPLHYW